MNELAKRLADAGFPYKSPEDFPYVPALRELIDACRLPLKLDCRNNAEKWYAMQGEVLGTGDTPEEAVANLWLELNKK